MNKMFVLQMGSRFLNDKKETWKLFKTEKKSIKGWFWAKANMITQNSTNSC